MMFPSVAARSISRPLYASLVDEGQRPRASGRLLGAFERACDLWLEGVGVVAVVDERIGDGPFHVVVTDDGGGLGRINAKDSVRLGDGSLSIGDLTIDLRPAKAWEPCPAWSSLRGRLEAIRTALGRARQALDAERSPLLAAVLGGEASGPTAAAVRAARPEIEAGWAGDYEAVGRGAAMLAGRGPGLTPAGDDFLLGTLVWAWLCHPSPLAFGWAVGSAALPRTTTLAGAWIGAAAEGQLAAPWHRLLDALASTPTEANVGPALDSILEHGATSGADALAGLLWLADR